MNPGFTPGSDTTMKLLMLAAAGGAIGAGARFLVNQAFASTQFERGVAVFPWATLTVNVVGGLLMGFVYVLVNQRLGGSPEWRTFLATGILGGLTTFSAFSLDMFNLAADRQIVTAAIYALASVGLSFFGLLAGMWAARLVLT
jgi:fluoride exporter